MAQLTSLTQLQLSGSNYRLASSDRLPRNLAAATLLCGGDAAVLLPQLSRLQRLQLGSECTPTAGQLRKLAR
jgi:hypothetical protein